MFNDILTNVERVSDHCSNLALEMLEVRDDTMASHGYLHELKAKEKQAMEEAYEDYAGRYAI